MIKVVFEYLNVQVLQLHIEGHKQKADRIVRFIFC